MAGEAVSQTVQDIADHGASGGCYHPDHTREIGQGLLAFRRKQAFGFRDAAARG